MPDMDFRPFFQIIGFGISIFALMVGFAGLGYVVWLGLRSAKNRLLSWARKQLIKSDRESNRSIDFSQWDTPATEK